MEKKEGFSKRDRFKKPHRLIKHRVVSLLRDGVRLGRGEVGLTLGENRLGYGRMAIAVPKRILKLAVDRNRIKRAIREEFRQHPVRLCPVDMLVTLRSQPVRKRPNRVVRVQAHQSVKRTLSKLLSDVNLRFGVGR